MISWDFLQIPVRERQKQVPTKTFLIAHRGTSKEGEGYWEASQRTGPDPSRLATLPVAPATGMVAAKPSLEN